MTPSPRPGAAFRIYATALILIGLALLAFGVAYLTVPAYGLPRFLPHGPSSTHTSTKHGGAALAAAALCFVGAWLVARHAATSARR
jgi:hypothetical protein